MPKTKTKLRKYFFLQFVYLAIVHETFQETLAEQERLGIEYSLPFDKYLHRGLINFLSWIRLGKRLDSEECESKEARDTLLEVKNALLKLVYNQYFQMFQ